MTGLDVADPQPLWLSLQHTPPSVAALVGVLVVAAGVLAEVAAALVVVAAQNLIAVLARMQYEI